MAKKDTGVGPRWGATTDEWDLFTRMGLVADLLPVVSNPQATVSPHSKIAGIGKTPSHYNGMGHVAGLPGWTDKQVTAKQVGDWSKNPDYGICLQTRNVRAFDIDVDDREKAQAIADFLADELLLPPKRYRANSGKCLLAFRVAGELPKRMLPVDGGVDDKGEPRKAMVEFLGNGQQFIAAGTHTSGVRYLWDWYGQADFPEVALDDFERVWAALVERFGTGVVGEGGVNRKKGERLAMDDVVVDILEKKGLALGYGRKCKESRSNCYASRYVHRWKDLGF